MLERLDHVRVAVGDPAAVAADYAALLRVAPARVLAGGVYRLEVGGVGLVLEPVEPAGEEANEGGEARRGGRGGGGREGVRALVFAGTPPAGGMPSLAESRGIALQCTAPVEADPPAERPAAPDGAERLDHVVVLTSDHAAALRLYGERLGLRLALDRSFPRRGVRLLFFRVAGVTVEIGGPIEPGPEPSGRDGFGGLAWRGADVVAWRERLLAEGFDVSGHRAGHKAGTRVCTVRGRTGSVPTLLISPDPFAGGSD